MPTNKTLQFSQPITSWDEALPLGNGQMGALLWGEDRIKLSLDRVDIWDTDPAPETFLEDYNYQTMVNAYKAKDKDAVDRLFDSPYNRATPSKLLAGRVEIVPDSPVSAMSGVLDFETAEARVTLTSGPGETMLRTFIHAVNGIGFARIESGGERFDLSVVSPDYQKLGLAYPPTKAIDESGVRGFVQIIKDDFQYAVLVAGRGHNGVMDITFTVATATDLFYDFSAEKEKLTAALDEGYEKELERHKEWWRDYYARSKITLPDNAIMKMYNFNHYLLACVSRKGCPPMPLQGVFTADNGELPPWKGDYHNDLNTQMCYISYLKSNHLPEGESFLDFLTDLIPQAKKYSASFFDAPDGLNLPGVMTIDGKPMGGWPMYSYSISNAAWLCYSFSEYYDYTLDENFLKTRMYPFLKGVGLCIKRWLADNGSGYLELPNSCSPEINDNTFDACFEKNTNYDISLCHFLFGRLVEICEAAGDAENKALWSGIFSKLRPLAAGPNGLKINEDFDLHESHRHMSHAMAVYPLRLMRYEGEHIEVIDRTIEYLKKLGVYYWVGYTFGWMAEFCAIQKNGEAARYYLNSYTENFTSPNGFHLNGDYNNRGFCHFTYRPFTLEGNMMAMDVVQEMLLYCENGVLEVFPAIPKAWAKQGASFETLRAKGALLVSSAIENNMVKYIRIKAQKDVSIRVINPFKHGIRGLLNGKPLAVPEDNLFELRAGDLLVLEEI